MINNAASAPSRALAARRLLATATALVAGSLATPGYAGGTLAGTDIRNVATATYELPGGVADEVTSNIVTLKVDELLDVTVASADPSDIASTSSATGQVLSFTVTNGGNGTEGFTLSTIANGGGDDFDPTVTAIVLDANANNAYDAGVDTVYVAGSNDPALAPEQSLTVFILATIPSAAEDGGRGKVELKAVAKTGSGTPGTAFAGLGQSGGNAVVGATGAAAADDGFYAVSRAALAFVKSASVADPFGGTTQVPGATITYTLTATVSGSGSLANLRVADAIPDGTTFKPASLLLDGTALSDVADADAGAFDGTGIAVRLGNLSAGSSRIVKFQVKID